jgi:hypothetical protein
MCGWPQPYQPSSKRQASLSRAREKSTTVDIEKAVEEMEARGLKQHHKTRSRYFEENDMTAKKKKKQQPQQQADGNKTQTIFLWKNIEQK